MAHKARRVRKTDDALVPIGQCFYKLYNATCNAEVLNRVVALVENNVACLDNFISTDSLECVTDIGKCQKDITISDKSAASQGDRISFNITS